METQGKCRPIAIRIDGVGGAMCDVDGGVLAYSWFVRFSDGTNGHYCSQHCPGEGEFKPERPN